MLASVCRLLLVAALIALAPSTAQAQWRRADSQNFVVYSDGSERSLRDYTARLERFDGLLTTRLGGPQSGERRRLHVYLVGDGRALRVAVPGLPSGISGYYSTSEHDVFAILVRGESDDLLLHEYSHHAMARAGNARYPAWFSEGFAEYFATATVTEAGEASFGLPSPARMRSLQQNRWLPMDVVLRAESSLVIDTEVGRGMFYAQAWALTHWLLADADRVRSLSAYVAAVNGGGDPVETWRTVFGMSPEQLTEALRAHVRGRLTYARVNIPPVEPEITVTSLSPAAGTVLLPALNARFWDQDKVDGPALLQTLRAAAARFPDDPLALVGAGRAEMRWGDLAAAETALSAALERQADNVEGLILMADLATRRAADSDDAAEQDRQLQLARDFLQRAREADPTDSRIYSAQRRYLRSAGW